MIATDYAHIVLNDEDVPVLEGTHVKVVEIAEDYVAYRSPPEEMQRELPHLTVGQILSALAYYYDHKDEIDAELERRRRVVREYRAEFGDGRMALSHLNRRADWAWTRRGFLLNSRLAKAIL